MFSSSFRFALTVLLLHCAVGIADTPQPGVKLGKFVSQLEVCSGCDLSGKHLKGSDFVGQKLDKARFDGCDLAGVLFHDCDLTEASFRNCSLSDCRIFDCKLNDADFSGAIVNKLEVRVTGLSPKQFASTKSYLTKNLSWCQIPGPGEGDQTRYDFRKANLRGSKLDHGDFRRSDFEGALLFETEFDNIDVLFDQLKATANFQRRGLRGHKFKGVRFDDAVDFTSLNLSDVSIAGPLKNAKYDDADISRAKLRASINGAQLATTRNFRRGDLSDISVSMANFSGIDFSGKNLTGAQFAETDLTGADFEDAVITGTRFGGGIIGLTADQIKSTWNFRHKRLDGIQLPVAIATALEEGARDEVSVQGIVMVNRRPLENGSLLFSNGTTEFETTLGKDGHYKVESLDLGRSYKVIINSDQVRLPERYNTRSLLTFTPSGSENKCDFSLNLRKGAVAETPEP